MAMLLIIVGNFPSRSHWAEYLIRCFAVNVRQVIFTRRNTFQNLHFAWVNVPWTRIIQKLFLIRRKNVWRESPKNEV